MRTIENQKEILIGILFYYASKTNIYFFAYINWHTILSSSWATLPNAFTMHSH